MATQTTNIGLTQAAESEYYSVDVVNENLEKIDTALGDIQNAVGGSNSVSDRIGSHDDTEAGTVFGDLNIVKVQTGQISTDAAEIKTKVNGNADKLDAMKKVTDSTNTVAATINTRTVAMEEDIDSLLGKADNINTVASSNGTKLDSALSKIDTANTQITNTRNLVSTVNTNVSSNGTKLDTLADKADGISGQVQTVGNNVSAVKTDIASVKTTVESTSGKADTAVELLNLLKAIATTKTKPLICCKGIKENADWQTVVSISGSGVLEKAFARSATSDGLVRITIDDEVVLVTKAAYQDVVGAIKDDLWSSDAPQSVIVTSDGGFMWYSINKNGEWYVGFPGSAERSNGCMCVIPGGIRFEKNFKFEVKAITAGVIITGEVSENSVVTTL